MSPFVSTSHAGPPRLYQLDALRGLASLAIVVWHYQHFFYVAPGTLAPGFDRASQPFHQVLAVLYTHGHQAVQLFFVLSGYIFFHLYRERIAGGGVTVRAFFVLRFSRLYPLHFATLVYVAFAQLLVREATGAFAVYPYNDAKHFALNLVFASHWGFEDGWSFNAPVWSVSIEVLLYAVFFMLAVRRMTGPREVLGTLICALAIVRFTSFDALGWGLFCFFAGGLACHVREAVAARGRTRFAVVAAAASFAAACAIVAFSSGRTGHVALLGGVFPSLVLCLALVQDLAPDLGRSLRWLGDVTYSTYLLHFPSQLTVIGVVGALGASLDFTTGGAFLLYIAALLALAVVVHRLFEIPAQDWLRRRWLPARE